MVEAVEQTRDGVKVRFYSRLKALEALGRILALFTERHHHVVEQGGIAEISPTATEAEWEAEFGKAVEGTSN